MEPGVTQPSLLACRPKLVGPAADPGVTRCDGYASSDVEPR